MNAEAGHNVHDDLLAKMDALLRRHQVQIESVPAPSPAPEFPVLTDVVQVDDEEVIPVLTDVVEEETEMMEFPFLLLEEVDAESVPESSAEDFSSRLSAQSLENLDRQIQDILDQRLSAHVVSAMDRAMAGMLDQFSMQVESVVREAVAEELRKQLGKMGGHANEASD